MTSNLNIISYEHLYLLLSFFFLLNNSNVNNLGSLHYFVVYRCSLPLGLENGHVPDAAFSASSSYDAKHAPARARLNIHKDSKGIGSWAAKTNNGKQWLQIDFGELVRVTKVATQGRQDYSQWVTKFTLSFSVDGMHWVEYKENSVTWVSKYNNITINGSCSCRSNVADIETACFSKFQKPIKRYRCFFFFFFFCI